MLKLSMLKATSILGVIIDSELKWKLHIDLVTQKLKHSVGIHYKLQYNLPDWCLRNIYFAFIHPYTLCSKKMPTFFIWL